MLSFNSLKAEFFKSGEFPERGRELRERVVGEVEYDQSPESTDGCREFGESVVLDVQFYQMV